MSTPSTRTACSSSPPTALSAFDVILPDPIPGKGRILTAISDFWFARTGHIIRNHLLQRPLSEVLPDAAEAARRRKAVR